VIPPGTPMIDQLIGYLETLSDSESKRPLREAGVSIAALTVRWASYYAVLADATRPPWTAGLSLAGRGSRINDGEMRRINIEASYALSRLIQIYQSDIERYWSLLRRAVQHLSLPRKSARRDADVHGRLLLGMATAKGRHLVKTSITTGMWNADYDVVAEAPARIIANAIMHGCWRNGPIEDIHAGASITPQPLLQCRVPQSDDGRLFRSLSDRLVDAAWALFELFESSDSINEPVVERAMPFFACRRSISMRQLAAPEHWSRNDSSDTVRLTGAEPAVDTV
jgi:hypothetical protein